MDTIKSYIGFSKAFINLRVKLGVFLFISRLLIRREVPRRDYFRILRRLLYFLSKMKNNKYVRIGKYIKMNLYVPPYPSPAFFTACRKMLEFEAKMPCVSTLISVTSACKYKCQHCYQKLDKGKDADINLLVATVKKMQDKGMAFFNIEGGEPFLVYDRLLEVCKAVDSRSEIIINTTGDGVTLERLLELNRLGNVNGLMFSLHYSSPEALNDFTGNGKAWQNMTHAIHMAHKAGIPVMFNTCLQPQAFTNGTFESVMEAAKEFKAVLLQLIKPKPSGGWLEKGVTPFQRQDVEQLKKKVHAYNTSGIYKQYPFVYSQLIEEESKMFGCTAGGTDRFYLNAKGDVQPCEFLNISFGNIHEEDFDVIYARMRKTFDVPGDTWLCEQYAADIYRLFNENKSDSLPLNKKLSELIISKWNRGAIPDFYDKMRTL